MKNVYIFEDVDKVSSAYHKDGGVVFIASCRENVEDLAIQDGNIILTDEDWNNVKIYPLDQKQEFESKVFVFPDAGCC